MQILEHEQIPHALISNLLSRDAALWLASSNETEIDVSLLYELMSLPWQLVICEATDARLAKALESSTDTASRLARRRGFLHIVASSDDIEMPPRALPIYFLNGRDDARTASEAPNLPGYGNERRRMKMIGNLISANPRMLFAVDVHDGTLLDIKASYDEGLRSLLIVQADLSRLETPLPSILDTFKTPSSVDLCLTPISSAIETLLSHANAILPEDRTVITVRAGSQLRQLDITECDLIEQPIFDRYEVIQARDIVHLAPEDLTEKEFTSFFDRSEMSWRPYAANLPWIQDPSVVKETVKALRQLESFASDYNSVRIVASESGAGGTTCARAVALQAARDGFPTLVAKSIKFSPNTTELENFFFQVRKALNSNSSSEKEQMTALSPPWLLVYDIQHWEGNKSEIPRFAQALYRSGQSAVILVVSSPDIGDELTGAPHVETLITLQHALTEADALALGNHLNHFLRRFGKEKSEMEWRMFWQKHRPLNMHTPVASFWIALQFWLRGQLDISETIQQWLQRQYAQADLPIHIKRLLLEIAVLSIERQPYPESLLPPSPEGNLPYSILLEQVRTNLPALALVNDGLPPNRQWAMAHDVLGRYLVNLVYGDQRELVLLQLSDIQDPVRLRLAVLREIATREEMKHRQSVPLAIEFAVNILKLGVDGNLDFSRHWKEVLEILEDMPDEIWNSSRSFNHHVAISRRRVTTTPTYHLNLDEMVVQLDRAIEHLNFALKLPKNSPDDESQINLLNSLSLAYQNLAEVEKDRGADEARLQELRDKATEAARKAHNENPTNSFVLETFARNLLQNCRLYPSQSVECSAEALGFIYQAMSVDHSLLREAKLNALTREALSFLRGEGAEHQIQRLCDSNNPLGYLAKALLSLLGDEDALSKETLERLPRERLQTALEELNSAPIPPNGLLLRFKYDLVAIAEPLNFEEQLNILLDLSGTANQMPLQLQLEYAILLHQRNRHVLANAEFKNVRQSIRTQEAYIDVPPRLKWLITDDGRQRVCSARVFETGDFRSQARVAELDTMVPFIAQEFSTQRMPAGMTFSCAISFGPRGPFIRPPSTEKGGRQKNA